MNITHSLSNIVGATHVLTEPAQIAGYTTDYTRRWTSYPLAVVRPENSLQISQIVQLAAQSHISITPQGGNTSLVGGGIGRDGGIILSTTRLKSSAIDQENHTLQGGAGLTLAQAQEIATAHNLIFPINTASRDSATLGGIIATNAGGTRAIRWGSTRKHLIGLEAVLSDGTIVRRMRPLYRDNIGYDLPQLFVGSEGTLGIITETLFRLHPKVNIPSFILLVPAESFSQGLKLLDNASAQGCTIEAAEFMTHIGANLVASTSGIPLPFPDAKLIFLIELSTNQADPYEQFDSVLSTVFSPQIVDQIIIEAIPSPKLWHLREGHTEAINKKTRTPVIKLDISVPGSRLDDFINGISQRVAKYPPAYPICFGHFGEGNVHTNILDSNVEDYAGISTEIFEFVSQLGGSISAEHGIGRAKAKWAYLNRSPEDIATMQRIRTSIDPAGIFAPELLNYAAPNPLTIP